MGAKPWGSRSEPRFWWGKKGENDVGFLCYTEFVKKALKK